MQKMNKWINGILQFIGILGVIVFSIWAVNFFVGQKTPPVQPPPPIVLQPPQCDADFGSYQSLASSSQFVELLPNGLQNTYAVGGVFANDTYVTVTRAGTGQVACGYLYVEAGIDGHSLDPKYDSVYISPQGFGGHLLASKTISIPNVPTSTTEFLLPLAGISYLAGLPYNPNSQNFSIANWVNLLNTANAITFHIGLSTTDPRGEIKKVIIAYKCWNPASGQPSADCQLGVQ